MTIGRDGTTHGMKVGGSMGLTTWAAFSGSEGRPEELATGMRSALDARAAVGKKGKY